MWVQNFTKIKKLIPAKFNTFKVFKNWQNPFSRKIYFCPNVGKKDSKWSQNRIFWILWKILSLVFLGNNLKWKLVIDISPSNSYMIKFWVLSYRPKCCWSIKWQDSLKCNISRKKWMMKFIFGMQINTEVFYKLMLSFWVFVTRHPKVPKISFH